MNKPIVYRQGRMFKLNESLLPKAANTSLTKNDIYLSIYKEFSGAGTSDKYKHMTNEQKIQAVCDYVDNWLIERKFK